MPADDYFVPTDIGAMRMENELLSLENTFLKGRVASLEQELRTAREREARARQAVERLRAEKAKR
jgi:septal ring factor EnvC (AmiA/AmiB activator)